MCPCSLHKMSCIVAQLLSDVPLGSSHRRSQVSLLPQQNLVHSRARLCCNAVYCCPVLTCILPPSSRVGAVRPAWPSLEPLRTAARGRRHCRHLSPSADLLLLPCRATPEEDVLRRDIFDRPPVFR